MKNIYDHTEWSWAPPSTDCEAKLTDLPLPHFSYLKDEPNNKLPCWIVDWGTDLEAS